MFKLKMKQTFIGLIILLLLAVAGCNNSGTDKSKELELKEKELALKEKELGLKDKDEKDTPKKKKSSKKKDKEDETDEDDDEEITDEPKPEIVTAKQVNGTWSLEKNKIKILALGGGKLKVQFDLKGGEGPSEMVGTASGTANIDGIDATFAPDSDYDSKCKFAMKFTGGKLVIKDIGEVSDCEFGSRVDAEGTYTKTNPAKPTFD